MSTIDYYNKNARKYFDTTYSANMGKQYDMFLKYLKETGRILDYGCGSGRDSLYFKNLGYDVTAIDGSEEMCKLASEYTGLKVRNMDFLDLDFIDYFDGIWACASILHVDKRRLIDVLVKMRDALKKDGYIYTTLKNGHGEEITREGRYYNYLTKEEFLDEASRANLHLVEYNKSISVTNVNEEKYWNNFVLKR